MTDAKLKDSTWVCVLNNNETYSEPDGCWIAPTPPDVVQLLDQGDEPDEHCPDKWSLQALLEWAIDQGYFDHDESQKLIP